MIDPFSFNTLMRTIRTVFPDGEVGQDMDGQVVIYTGLKIASGDRYAGRCSSNLLEPMGEETDG